jgi:hypothetical protein
MLDGVRPRPKGKIVLAVEASWSIAPHLAFDSECASEVQRLLLKGQKWYRELPPTPSSFPIRCSRDKQQTSCANIPPICSLFTRSASTERGVRGNCELLYVAVAFHDFGLVKKFSTRFEVDGANTARQFLTAPRYCWRPGADHLEAIAPHTTPGIPKYMGPEVALLNSGVLLDVIGVGLDQFPVEVREEIVAKYPAQI